MKPQQTFSSSFIGNKTGTLRAMFYNVFGYDKVDPNDSALRTLPKPLRQKLQAELIGQYDPDFIGFQEYSGSFHRVMSSLLCSLHYTEVNDYHTFTENGITESVNYTPLFYRADRLTLLEHGALLYPETMPHPDGVSKPLCINDVKSKSLTWAVFEKIATGKRFIAINTHFMYSAYYLSKTQAEAVRVQNAENLLRALAKVKSNEAYAQLPVIMGGDLNGFYGEPFLKLLTESGFEWLYRIAPVKDNSCGMHEYALQNQFTEDIVRCPYPRDNVKESLDYVFTMQGNEENQLSVSSYVTITDRNALLSSDHCPRFADITLK